MTDTRKLLSIRSISDTAVAAATSPVRNINCFDLADNDKSLLADFFNVCIQEKEFYIDGAYEIQMTFGGGTTTDIIQLSHPILLRPRSSHPDQMRAEIIGRRLGKGSYAEVFSCLSAFALEDSSVTLIPSLRIAKVESVHRKKDEKSEDFLKRISRESNLGIQAGYIRQKRPVFHKDKRFLVSAFFQGKELFDFIDDMYSKKITYSTDDYLQVVLNILYGLQELHDRGVLSRDIKPENILINCTTKETVHIDLGLGKFIQENDIGVAVGSAGYCSPETLEKKGMSEKSDIFSVGIVIAYVLGSVPMNPDPDNFQEKCDAAMHPTFYKLFRYCPDLSYEHRDLLGCMIQGMTHQQPSGRPSLDDTIFIVENILLQRKNNPNASKAYDAAIYLRDKLQVIKLPIAKVDALSDCCGRMDKLVEVLNRYINECIQSVPDDHHAIRVFLGALRVSPWQDKITIADLQKWFSNEISQYQRLRAEFAKYVIQLLEDIDSIPDEQSALYCRARYDWQNINAAPRLEKFLLKISSIQDFSRLFEKMSREIQKMRIELRAKLGKPEPASSSLASMSFFYSPQSVSLSKAPTSSQTLSI